MKEIKISKPYLCYCCETKTKNFRVYKNGKKQQYCIDCIEKYSHSERKVRAYTLINEVFKSIEINFD